MALSWPLYKDKVSFLTLSAELCNQIYEDVARSATAHLKEDGVKLNSPLFCVCRQVREEYLSVLNDHPLPVYTTVEDFNFDLAIGFVNACQRKPSLLKKYSGGMHITLHMTPWWFERRFICEETMETISWVFSRTKKHFRNIDVSYIATRDRPVIDWKHKWSSFILRCSDHLSERCMDDEDAIGPAYETSKISRAVSLCLTPGNEADNSEMDDYWEANSDEDDLEEDIFEMGDFENHDAEVDHFEMSD